MNRRAMTSAALAALLLIAAAAACGRKTDPLTPASPRPEAVKDMKVAVRDRIAYLTWMVPSRNVEGKPMAPADIAAFRVYRAELDRSQKRPRYRQIAEISMAEPAPATVRDGAVSWSDASLRYDRVYVYRVRAYSARGGVSAYSDEVRAAPLLSLAAPKNITAAAGDSVITVSWEPVTLRTDGSVHQGFVGYNIYRGSEQDRLGEAPVNREPVRTATYEDTSVVNGQTYYYRVRAVDSPVLPGKESLDSPMASAQPVDRTPPAPPAGLTVVPGVGRVFLTWNENQERDLAGYHVYRATKPGGEYKRLTEKLLNRSTFSDETVQPGVTYYYAVTASDTAGNESARSRERKAYTEKVR